MKIVVAAALVWSLAVPSFAEETRLLIVSGLEGDREHGDLFHQWATQLISVATDRYHLAPGNIVYLAEKPDRDPARIRGRSTRENVEREFGGLAAAAQPGERIFIVLFGHGSFDGVESRFSLPGPDLSATDFGRLLIPFRSQQIIFVSTTSASGEFVAVLSAPGRTIVTATASGGERNDTHFPAFFVEAFATDAADVDKNGRVSVLEAFNYARSQVARTYERDGFLPTEHALLDDNGDRKGSREIAASAVDGQIAGTLYLGSTEPRLASASTSSDPALKTLYQEKQALEEQIEALKRSKGGMNSGRYAQELERLLTELAMKSQTIRQLEGKPR